MKHEYLYMYNLCKRHCLHVFWFYHSISIGYRKKKYLTLKIYFQSVLFFNEPSKLFLHTCTFSIFCILMDKERYTKKCFCILRNGLYSDFKFYSDNSSSSFSYLIHGEKLLKFTTFYRFVQTLHYTGNIFYCEVNLWNHIDIIMDLRCYIS